MQHSEIYSTPQKQIRPKSLYLATPPAFNPPPLLRRRGSLHYIIVSDIPLDRLETRCVGPLGYIHVAESLGISSTTFTQCSAPRKLPSSLK